MSGSNRNVSFPRSLHQRPSTSSVVTKTPEDTQRRIIVERVPCSGLKPPRYPNLPSQSERNQYSSARRSTTRRRRKSRRAGRVGPSGNQNTGVPRQAGVRQGCRDGSEAPPCRPVQATQKRAECHKEESAEDTPHRAKEHERVKGETESATRATRAACGRERRRQAEEKFLLHLSRWKAEADHRNMREQAANFPKTPGQEAEQGAQGFEGSGVYRREQHRRPRCWTAARVWKPVRGFADIAVVEKPPLGVWERVSLRS